MLAEWSAECAADDPVLVVPWTAAPGMGDFVDLRENPYDLDHIPEAEQHPPLLQALRALNAPRSPVFSAKCDAWPLAGEELEALQLNLDLTHEQAPEGFASYIDLLWRERALFVSFHQQEQRLTRITRAADALDHPYAALDCILRPAVIDLTGPQEGFAFSLYVTALGTDAPHAYENWSRALEAITTLLRSKDFATT
jgi:hypothetical protein